MGMGGRERGLGQGEFGVLCVSVSLDSYASWRFSFFFFFFFFFFFSRAARTLRSGGICDVTPGLLLQLRQKHPRREHQIPNVFPVDKNTTEYDQTGFTFDFSRRLSARHIAVLSGGLDKREAW